jgi:very-short-patch-repair endonuclease
MRQTTKATVAKARALRRIMSPAEVALWQILRTRPLGLKFRHQHPAGPFVLDFYCAAKKLAVEIDGIAHEMGDNPSGMRGGTLGCVKRVIRY